jgi:hypothetical protein
MKTTFLCWRPDTDGGPEHDCGQKVEAFDAGQAAEHYCDLHFSDWDYSTDIKEILVRSPEGKDTKFLVGAEQTVNFTATEQPG